MCIYLMRHKQFEQACEQKNAVIIWKAFTKMCWETHPKWLYFHLYQKT